MFLKFLINEINAGARLNIFLQSQNIPLAHIRRMKFIDNGILVNDIKTNTDYIIKVNDVVKILIAEEDEETNVIPQNIPLDIVYQDEHCMVVNKPYNMPVHPSLNHTTDTLANAFCGYFKNKGMQKSCRIINRLDKNTSGLVLIALNSLTAEGFKGKVDKMYTAIVKGEVEPLTDVIELNIDRVDNSIITRCVSEKGKYAKTEYTVIKQNNEYSLLDIVLLPYIQFWHICLFRSHILL